MCPAVTCSTDFFYREVNQGDHPAAGDLLGPGVVFDEEEALVRVIDHVLESALNKLGLFKNT